MQTRTDAPTVAQSPANNAWQRFGVQPVGSKKRSKAEDKSRVSVGCLWSLSHGERWEILLTVVDPSYPCFKTKGFHMVLDFFA